MNNEPTVRRTIVKETVPSSELPEGSRNLRVYLPPGFNELFSYPVVYCQDGEDFFNFGRIATQAQGMILEGELEPMIVVGVDVDKSVRTDEYAPDGERHPSYVRFFAEEMVPYIQGRYPVRMEPEQILLAGDSLGGSVSLHIALAYPGRFAQVLSLSGAYYPVSAAAVRSAARDLSWLRIRMLVGLQETAYETDRGVFDFVALNREMRSLLEARGADVDYSEKEGKHQWGFWQKEVPDALRWFRQE